jgi:hypothetical protein
MARKVYRYRVIALGLKPHIIARNIEDQRSNGWTLVSTYMDANRALQPPEPSVVGIFETWEKVRR